MNSHTKTKAFSAVLASILLLQAVPAHAARSAVDFAQAKTSFEELWHQAADTSRKRMELMQQLTNYDKSVEDAKKNLEKAKTESAKVELDLKEQEHMLSSLNIQLQALDDSKKLYEDFAKRQRNELVTFVRFVASRNYTVVGSDDDNGGVIMNRILRGSLGDAVEHELTRSAVAAARNQFIVQLFTLSTEVDNVKERLGTVKERVTKELKILQEKSKNLKGVVDKTSKYIDNSWKERELTQQELEHVIEESAQADTQIAQLQGNLKKIEEQLKQQKLDVLDTEKKQIEADRKVYADARDALLRKDQALKLVEDAALKAFNTALSLKNTDKKLYQDIEEDSLRLKNLQEQYDAAKAEVLAPTPPPVLTGSGTATGTIATPPAKVDLNKLKREIDILSEQLQMMLKGIPREPSKDYAFKKFAAADASLQRQQIAVQMITAEGDLRSFDARLDKVLDQMKDIQEDRGMQMKEIFQWPVLGTITAGFHDDDYKRVFGIEHRAIDIAVGQGTKVGSVADGVVFSVQNGGATGYSFVLIGHSDGYASLYGHLSKILVKKGDIVTAGQTIGYSGGLPGTPGAGHMTTGAHVHLEMMKDGKHFDPRTVLPARS